MDALNEIFNDGFYKDESDILKENITTYLSLLNNFETASVLIFIDNIISNRVVKSEISTPD